MHEKLFNAPNFFHLFRSHLNASMMIEEGIAKIKLKKIKFRKVRKCNEENIAMGELLAIQYESFLPGMNIFCIGMSIEI